MATKRTSQKVKESEIQLRVYDLSKGIAGPLSIPILGRQVDGIWHTGVLVFDSEYFYGGGIQSLPPREVERRYNLPVHSIVPLGKTRKNLNEFRNYLESIKGSFAPEQYHLLRHNCNHFSDQVVKWLRGDGTGIPQHIRDLPNVVLSSPLAQNVLVPLIESMHNNIHGVDRRNQNNGGTTLKFGADELNEQYGQDLVEFFSTKRPPRKAKMMFHFEDNLIFVANYLDVQRLLELRVTHIVNISPHKLDTKNKPESCEILEMILDDGEIDEPLEIILAFLHDAQLSGGKAVILGDDFSSTSAMLVAYFLEYEQPRIGRLEQLLYKMRSRLPSFYPSFSILKSLISLELSIVGTNNKLNVQALNDLHLDRPNNKLARALKNNPVSQIKSLNIPGVTTEEQIRNALQRADGNVDRAVNLLLDS